MQTLDEGQQTRDAEEAQRGSPEALAARETSRTAYENLNTEQVVKIASQAFPTMIDEPGGGPPQLPSGQHITGFPSDNVAAIDLGAGKRGVLESLEPMAIEASPARHTPIDLSLSHVGSAFQPANPEVSLRIPKRLSDGIQLPRSGVSLTPVDASGSPLEGSEGTIDDATVLYSNTGTDSDTVIKPETTGFAADTLLRSEASPQQLFFKLGLPEGASPVEAKDGSGAVEVVKEGTTLAVVLPPLAHDAAGTAIPVSMSLKGDALAVTVDHGPGSYQMPIEVDPTVGEGSTFSSSPGPWLPYEPYPNWHVGWYCCASDEGLNVQQSGGPDVGPGQFAYFQYHTQGKSEIYALSAVTRGFDTSGGMTVKEFLQAGGHLQESAEVPGGVFGHAVYEEGEYSLEVCTYANCPPTEDGYDSNTAYWQVSEGAEDNLFHFRARSAAVYITQSTAPTVEPDTKDINAFNDEAKKDWARGEDYLDFNGFDSGIGIYQWQIHTYPSDEAGWTGRLEGKPDEGGQCTGVQCAESWTFKTRVGNLPDGTDQVQATVENATGLTGSVVGSVKVDNTPPAVTFSGSLAAANEKTIGQGSYQLSATVQDGSGNTPSSGVWYAEMKLDGTRVVQVGESGDQPGCTPGPCARELSYTLTGSTLTVGKHVITVSAVDYAGNETYKQIVFSVNNAASAPIGPGTVDLTTGAYTLKAQDVSVSALGGPLTVGRTYTSNAPHLKDGPLGRSWELTLPNAEFQTLQKNGEYEIFAHQRGSAQVTFYSRGGNTYYGPAGAAGMTVTMSGTTATLTDRSGDTTTFTETSAGSRKYALSGVQTPGALGATTYTMEAAGAVTRPKQELAPAPAGVSCATLVKGCRALGFVYTNKTSSGHLKEVTFTAWDPAKGEMTTTPVAEYHFNGSNELASEWDPRISPALTTGYGYGPGGVVTAVTPPGQEPFLLSYGTIGGDASTGRLLSITRPSASTAEGVGSAPENKTAPKLSKTTPVIGTTLKIYPIGGWTNKPLVYSYQWERCNALAGECAPISGATNLEYTPQASDAGYTLKAQVTAGNASGAVAAATAASAVVPLPAPSYSLAFGSKGTGTGQLSNSASEASDASGDVWLTDTGNNRLEEFSPSGTLMEIVGWGVKDGKAELEVCKAGCQAGIAGSGNGQFSSPWGIAINKSTGNIYVSDQANFRIEEISASAAFITAFGSYGTGAEQFSTLAGLAIDSSGDLYVADFGNNWIDKFSPSGINLGRFGSSGSGNGQFSGPVGIAFSGGNIYVNDYNNNRIEEFATSGAFIRQFGSKGSGEGQFSGPYGIATEPVSGDLYVTDCGNDRVQVFNPAGGYVGKFGSEGTGNGQFSCPTGIVASPTGELYVDDNGNGRVENWNPNYSTKDPQPKPPKPGTSAVSTIEYRVPVSGSGQAYPMGSTEVEAWGQKDDPVEATAIFPPDEVPASPAADYRRATVYYLDNASMTVNTAEPGGRISTSEYDEKSLSTVRTLTPANRLRALEAGAGSAAQSKLLDTQMTYNATGTGLVSELGPQHTVKLANGTQTEARPHVQYSYDEENAPSGVPYDLLTKVTSGAQINEQPEADIRTTTYSYSGQENIGLTLRKPTSVTTDPGGLNLVHTTLYEAATGNVEETRQPANPSGGDAHSTQSIYYTAGTNSRIAACGNHPEWAGLLCQRQPAAQPEGGLPPIPVVTDSSYNIWQEPLTIKETSGTSSRTSTNTYDAAERPKTTAIEGTAGAGLALSTVSYEYDAALGVPVKQSTGSGESLKTITSVFNKLAQLTSYTDADGNESTYSYDIDSRPEKTSDGKGTQTYSYDTTTGELTTLEDSAAGKFTASYDADGNPISEVYPNGMCANHTYNSVDEQTALQYIKTANCAETKAPVWLSDAVVPSIHGQWMTQTSTLSSQSYSHDNAGRLTQVQDTPSGQGCTTRRYAYDSDSNRTSLTSRNPGTKGECESTGGTEQSFSHDTADRLTDSGTGYDNFGNITTLPSADAGGNAVTNTYYLDNVLASQSQAGETIEYMLDPAGRAREAISSGTSASTVISHYAATGESPAWTIDSHGNWTRYISGIGGLIATQTNGATPVLQLANLHGDIVATAALSESATKLLSTTDTTEYGVPRTTPSKYSWLGASQRSTELPSGIISMGARAYVPQLGRFEQADPIQGGSANAYDYSGQDPVDNTDLGGAMYDTPYTPVLDMSGNAIATGFAAQAVSIYQAALAAQKAHDEAEEAARTASWEAQEAEWLRPVNEESSETEGVSLEEGFGSGGAASAARSFYHQWTVAPWVASALGWSIFTLHHVGSVGGLGSIPGWFIQIVDTATNDRLWGGLDGLAGNLSIAGSEAIGPVTITAFGSLTGQFWVDVRYERLVYGE